MPTPLEEHYWMVGLLEHTYVCIQIKTCPNAVTQWNDFSNIYKKNITKYYLTHESSCSKMNESTTSSASSTNFINFVKYKITIKHNTQTHIVHKFKSVSLSFQEFMWAPTRQTDGNIQNYLQFPKRISSKDIWTIRSLLKGVIQFCDKL